MAPLLSLGLLHSASLMNLSDVLISRPPTPRHRRRDSMSTPERRHVRVAPGQHWSLKHNHCVSALATRGYSAFPARDHLERCFSETCDCRTPRCHSGNTRNSSSHKSCVYKTLRARLELFSLRGRSGTSIATHNRLARSLMASLATSSTALPRVRRESQALCHTTPLTPIQGTSHSWCATARWGDKHNRSPGIDVQRCLSPQLGRDQPPGRAPFLRAAPARRLARTPRRPLRPARSRFRIEGNSPRPPTSNPT